MVGVDTHVVALQVEGKLAAFDVLQFILMQVRPAPQPRVDDVGEAFAPSDLRAECRERSEGTGSSSARRRPTRSLKQLESVTVARNRRVSYLQTPVKRSLNGHALAGMGSVGGDGSDEGVELVFLLLQLFHQALDGAFGKGFALASLPVAHQAVHNAQARVVAGRCVGDRHFDFRLSLSFSLGTFSADILLMKAHFIGKPVQA